MKFVEIYTDGACKGNPGVGGWGVLIRMQQYERYLYGGVIETTNNRMELTATIEGLAALSCPCYVKLTTDSDYVRKGITQWIVKWRKNNWLTSNRKKVANKDLWQSLDQLANYHKEVNWCWVKGHSGHPENEKADELANLGVILVESDPQNSRYDSGRIVIEQH